MKHTPTFIVLLVLIGCGPGPVAQGGGWGEDATNTRVGLSLSAQSLEVDVCSAGAANAMADITATTINPSLPPNTLTLSSARISYTALTAGAPPIADAFEALSVNLPATGLILPLMDADRKLAFSAAVTTGGYTPSEAYPQYRADYTLSGTDSYGSSFGVHGSLTFRAGMGVCPFKLEPGYMQVTGFPNPDSNTSDDITYHITGGRPPYTVFSDTASVVAHPGSLGTGVTSFVADINSVAVDTRVTLTAVDNDGRTATAILNVTTP